MKDRRFKNVVCFWKIWLLAFALLVPEVIIAKAISPNNELKAFIPIACVHMVAFSLFSIIFLKKVKKQEEEHFKKTLDKAKEQLTSEFRTVQLKSSNSISTERFECQAKLDENGEIVCKIHTDIEVNLESYEKFLEFFKFSDEE